MSAELSHQPAPATSKPHHYPGAMGLLVFTLSGPFFGMVGLQLGLAIMGIATALNKACWASASACLNMLGIQMAGIATWLEAVVIIMPLTVPVAYVLGFIPAALSGLLFLFARTYLGLSDRRAWQSLIAINVGLFALFWLGSVRINSFFDFRNMPLDSVLLLLWTNAFATMASGMLTGWFNRNGGYGAPA